MWGVWMGGGVDGRMGYYGSLGKSMHCVSCLSHTYTDTTPQERINRHDIDQRKTNIGLLRVRMPFCRHALSVRWVVL